jgi:hypothetical protein
VVADFDKPFARQRLEEQKPVGHPFALVFIGDALRLTGLSRERFAGIRELLFAGFVHPHLGPLGVIRLDLHFQPIFHLADKFGAGFGGNAIFLFQP